MAGKEDYVGIPHLFCSYNKLGVSKKNGYLIINRLKN